MKDDPTHTDPPVILGVDPGSSTTGYGLIQIHGRAYHPIDYGCIRSPSEFKLSERYLIIFDSIEALIQQYCPEILVVETQYVHKNVQSALKLGMARAAVMIAAKKKGLSIFAYTPAEAKRAVVGHGRANKRQVQTMVQCLLNLNSPPPEDAADALALAVCHAQCPPFLQTGREI
jgi:crossover junction endodeoxyribonuclease RuvC